MRVYSIIKSISNDYGHRHTISSVMRNLPQLSGDNFNNRKINIPALIVKGMPHNLLSVVQLAQQKICCIVD